MIEAERRALDAAEAAAGREPAAGPRPRAEPTAAPREVPAPEIPAPLEAPLPASPPPEPPPDDPGFELMKDEPPPGLVKRFFAIHRHLFGLLFGGLTAHVREGVALGKGRGLRLLFQLERLIAWLVRPFLDRELRDRPFPVQLRRRLEILGPTYIKLGQILALRQDLLPRAITEELKNLLDRLPVVSFPRRSRASR